MENINLTLFVCLMIPMSMMLLLFKDHSRSLAIFLLVGMFLCVLAGEINGLFVKISDIEIQDISVNIAPLVEEILKIIPIVFITFLMKPPKQKLAEYSLAVGVGFATLENVSLFVNSSTITLSSAILRALGAGMMHGICTLMVGISMYSVIEKETAYFSGTLAALCMSVIYHSIYNMLISSNFVIIGVSLPIATFVVIMIIEKIQNKKSFEKGVKI